MNLSIWNLLILIPPLILLEGLFSGAEIVLLSADRLLLKNRAKHGERGAQLALDLAVRGIEVHGFLEAGDRRLVVELARVREPPQRVAFGRCRVELSVLG